MIIKAFLLFALLLVVGGFGYFALSEPTINQTSITKTMSLSDIEASQGRKGDNVASEQAE